MTRINKLASKDVTFPETLDCEPCHEALDLWLQYKRDRRESYKSKLSIEILLRRWAKFGPEEFCDAVEFSIANNWQGIYAERKSGSQSRNNPQQHLDWQRKQAIEHLRNNNSNPFGD